MAAADKLKYFMVGWVGWLGKNKGKRFAQHSQRQLMAYEPLDDGHGREEEVHDGPEQAPVDGVADHCGGGGEQEAKQALHRELDFDGWLGLGFDA